MTQRCPLCGSCSCCHGGGIFSTSHRSPSAKTPSFSVLFSSSPTCHPRQPIQSFDEPSDLDPCDGNYYGSPVDCTLSLGTPSNRSSSRYETEQRSPSGSCMPNFCWDLFQPPKLYSSSAANSNGSGSGNINGCSSGNDSLIARRCANCDTASTPLWRNGPRGPKSLCNACGIRFKKEERRAAATTAGSGASGLPLSTAPHIFNSPGSWIRATATTRPHKMAPSCFSAAAISNEFQSADDDGGAGQDSDISVLSRHLTVADRPGLVHDFIR